MQFGKRSIDQCLTSLLFSLAVTAHSTPDCPHCVPPTTGLRPCGVPVLAELALTVDVAGLSFLTLLADVAGRLMTLSGDILPFISAVAGGSGVGQGLCASFCRPGGSKGPVFHSIQ